MNQTTILLPNRHWARLFEAPAPLCPVMPTQRAWPLV